MPTVVGTLMLLISGCVDRGSDRTDVIVFAAASLTDILEALGDDFEAQNPGTEVIVGVGASSTLARQIASGAPADLFLSASREWTDYLADSNRLVEGTVTLARNHLVVLAKGATPILTGPADLKRFDRIAIADPSHVPAGMYARDALTSAGIWEDVMSNLIPTLDVRAALATLDQGVVDAAIVYESDALVAPHLPIVLVWPEDLQPLIEITGAQIRGSGLRAAAFLTFLSDPHQQPVWIEFGFDVSRSSEEVEQ